VRIVEHAADIHDLQVEEDQPALDWDERSALILALMRIEAKLDELLRLWEDDDGEQKDADS